MTQNDKVRFIETVNELFRKRRINLFRIPTKELTQMIKNRIKHKSECTEVFATLQTFLLRRREFESNEEHTLTLQGMYYKMVHQNEDKDEAKRYKVWFEKLGRLKSYSFETDGRYVPIMSQLEAEEEKGWHRTVVIRIEKSVKEDSQKFAMQIHDLLVQKKINILRIPVDYLNLYLEGLQKSAQNINFYHLPQIVIAYKKENLNLLSEEELQKNKVFLEGKYRQLVEQNQDKKRAQEWRTQFSTLESRNCYDFTDYTFEQYQKKSQSSTVSEERLASQSLQK